MENQPVRLLLVDDDEDDYVVTRALLGEIAGGKFDLEWVATYHGALEEIRRRRHDLYLLDYHLGERNGLELMQEALRNGCDAPMILLTGNSAREVDVEAMKVGAADYLVKDQIDGLLLERSIRYALQQKRAAEALRESEDRYALAVRGASDGIWDWNLKTNEVYFSPRWKSMFGFEENEIGSSIQEWFNRVHPDDLGHLRTEIARHLEGTVPHFENEYRMRHRSGAYLWVLSRGLAVRDAEGQVSRMAGSLTDISKRKQAEERLLQLAFHDALTELPNRALFMERLEHAVARSARRKNLFAVLFVDLDRFKLLNDGFGHMIGDQLLVAVGRRLKACLRPADTVARLGGDEFVILLEDLNDLSDAGRLADRLQQELTQPLNLGGQEIFTAASIGIALSATGYERAQDLLRDADTAMSHAKAAGRGRYEVFNKEMHARAVAVLKLENDLRRAIECQEFRIHYQPIVDLKTSVITGFEALVRWQHPVRGLILPSEFIPVAEETGLISQVGQWVLREACRQTRIWQQQFPSRALTISVNLSGKQIMEPGLLKGIDRILQDTGLEGSSLGLEITESVIMENAESAISLLLQLQARNVRLHIDDFGTGYSSLNCLHRLPADTLKVDRSFVSGTGPDGENWEIVRTVVSLAHNLGLDVIAEGVETAKQLAQVTALECEYGQGYFFSRPLDPESAVALLAAESQIPVC